MRKADKENVKTEIIAAPTSRDEWYMRWVYNTKHEGKNTIWLQFENEISASSFVSQVYRRLDKISCSALRRDEHLSPNRRQKWLLAIRSDPHATPIKWILLMDSLTNMATMHDDSVSDSRESTSTNKSVALPIRERECEGL